MAWQQSRWRWGLFGLVMFAIPFVVAAQAATTEDTPYAAEIVAASTKVEDGQTIHVYDIRFTDGPEKGKTATIGDDEAVTSVGLKTFAPGDRVYVATIHRIDGTDRYLITDYVRLPGLWILGAVFIAAVAWFSRWQGVRSLLGLTFSFFVIIGWIVPQISAGANPVLTTLLGGSVVLIVGFLLTEGWSKITLAASASTIATMAVIGALSLWAVRLTHLTGEASEEVFFLQGATNGSIDIRGLLLAGFLIGAIGILDDIAVSQVVAVAELRRAGRHLRGWALYQAAMRIGRSHFAAILNTLFLAYAGASLPLLILFRGGGQPTNFILNGELIATEIVRAVVGSLGLILALPISTAMAVWLNVQPTHGPAANGEEVPGST